MQTFGTCFPCNGRWRSSLVFLHHGGCTLFGGCKLEGSLLLELDLPSLLPFVDARMLEGESLGIMQFLRVEACRVVAVGARPSIATSFRGCTHARGGISTNYAMFAACGGPCSDASLVHIHSISSPNLIPLHPVHEVRGAFLIAWRMWALVAPCP